jgi:peptide chain release factor 2
MSEPDFWDRKEAAQAVISELSACKNIIDPYKKLEGDVEDFEVLLELVEEAGADGESLVEAGRTWDDILKKLEDLEFLSFLSGEFDRCNAIITLAPGSGGTESCDWADMLLRTYLRWIERRGFEGEIMHLQSGDTAGIKSATIMVKGEYAYGYLRSERGVHRLVRISPFDSASRRHTSFAALDVVPEIDDDIEVELEDKDLRIDTYRSSGAGGQHVNVTDSAVRITHIPTGFVASCQNERSQHQNKATAMRVLRSKLYERQMAELRAKTNSEVGAKEDNSFGSQIRNYVLYPYQMVKDLRTEVETSDTKAVLDGDLDRFIEAYLRMNKNE